MDVHSHAVTESYLEFIKAHGAEMDEGFPIPGWNVEDHIAFMDRAGIETSVLTMPAPQPWFEDGAESVAFCRKYNEECAAIKARYPGRFLFCAALPLMDVLNKHKAVIITHPHKPFAVNDSLIADVPLASYEYLAETTRAIFNMVAHDVLVRYPDLKVA